MLKTTYVMSPETDTSSSDEDSSEDNVPLARLAQCYRHERENSESEDPIPKMELANHSRRQKIWCEDDSDSDSVSSSSSRLSDEQNIADVPGSMYCEDNNRNTLSVDSDKIVSVNKACVVPYQEIKSSKTNEPLEATCKLLSGTVGLLKASQKKLSNLQITFI